MSGLPEWAYERAADVGASRCNCYDAARHMGEARRVLDASGLADALNRVRALHTPVTEEAECWADGDENQQREHAERFPGCRESCEGHLYEMQVCTECGYTTGDSEGVYYRAWPCATLRALDAPAPVRSAPLDEMQTGSPPA